VWFRCGTCRAEWLHWLRCGGETSRCRRRVTLAVRRFGRGGGARWAIHPGQWLGGHRRSSVLKPGLGQLLVGRSLFWIDGGEPRHHSWRLALSPHGLQRDAWFGTILHARRRSNIVCRRPRHDCAIFKLQTFEEARPWSRAPALLLRAESRELRACGHEHQRMQDVVEFIGVAHVGPGFLLHLRYGAGSSAPTSRARRRAGLGAFLLHGRGALLRAHRRGRRRDLH